MAKYDKNLLKEKKSNIVIQINGKKRGLIETEKKIRMKKDLLENN